MSISISWLRLGRGEGPFGRFAKRKGSVPGAASRNGTEVTGGIECPFGVSSWAKLPDLAVAGPFGPVAGAARRRVTATFGANTSPFRMPGIRRVRAARTEAPSLRLIGQPRVGAARSALRLTRGYRLAIPSGCSEHTYELRGLRLVRGPGWRVGANGDLERRACGMSLGCEMGISAGGGRIGRIGRISGKERREGE